MSQQRLRFKNLTAQQFLADYWQKKPLLLKQALPDFKSPLSVDEVAGLALEEDIESRLIWEKHPSTKSPWSLEHGPFDATALEQLPTTGWSLLVQGVDQWIPEAAQCLNAFDFIPRWRFEDIMISLAPEGGSVGPHVDQYDVFLCQVEGERYWQWSETIATDLKFRQDTALNILDQPLPEPTQSALLSPGDVLYLPPGFAHHGVAQSFSQTWSIGFRAPDAEEILSMMAQRIGLESDANEIRYSDRDLAIDESTVSGLTIVAIDRIRGMLTQCLDRPEMIADTLGALVTRPTLHQQQWDVEAPSNRPRKDEWVTWNLSTRRTHFQQRLYVNGTTYCLPATEAKLIATLMGLESLPWVELVESAQTEQGLEVLHRLWDRHLLILKQG